MVWNGTTWTSVPHFPEVPRGVSCPAEDVCFVADLSQWTDGPKLVRWDGSAWAPVAGSETLPRLDAVSCSAVDTCVVMGSDNVGVRSIVLWHDGTFTTLPLTGPAVGLHQIDCPSATFCMMVGGSASGFGAASWSGGSVQTVDLGGSEGGSLTDVACASPSRCVASDSEGEGAVFDGTTWTRVTEPIHTQALACAPDGPCFASQTWSGLTRWTGSAWVDAGPVAGADAPALEASFTDASCPSPNACVAIGTYENTGGTRVLAESWNGLAWTVLPDLPLPAGAASVGDPEIDCGAPSACVAAVTFRTTELTESVLASWNGADWTVSRPSWAGAGAEYVVDDVACGSPTSCVAVGSAHTQGQSRTLFADGWDGTAWTSRPAPMPEPSLVYERIRLSCASPTFCARLSSGSIYRGSIYLADIARVQFFDGATWRTAPNPFPGNTDADSAYALDIDCSSASNCVVAGEGSSKVPNRTPVVAAWDGVRWRATKLSVPPDLANPSSVDAAVSCAAAGRCLTVSDRIRGTARPVAVNAWAGPRPSWSATNSPAQPVGWHVGVRSVACAGDTCLVVGDTRSDTTVKPAAFTYRFAP
jgi:hypothetical protein